MKTLISILSLAGLLAISSCIVSDDDGAIGPPGPQGPQGPQGVQGAPGETGFVMEWEGINFTSPNYEALLDFNDFDFEALESDVALVYLLWRVERIDGQDVEVWRPLPQTLLTNDGIFQYNFDFTRFDVNLFLDAEFPLDNLTADDTDNWIARVVVVPGEFLNAGGRRGAMEYEELEEVLGLPEMKKYKEGDVLNRAL